jgi:PKD repeat protein
LLVHDYVFNLDFYANVTTGFSPLNVQFYNKSQSPVDFWLWDFGDGVTSNEKNPTHTYFKNGVFTVTLLTGSPTTGYKMAEKEYYISTFPGINEFTALLLQQYNTTPHVAGMVNINAEQTSQLMNAIKEARQLLLLSSAVGKQLDLIGEIQGYSRSSDDDEEYRTLLQYASILNNSEGSAEDLISYCVHIISATDVHLYEIFPAGILIEVTSTKAIIPLYIEQLKQIKSAGVRLLGVTKIVDNEFRFDTEGSGFSYSTMNDNGHFSYLYGG